MLKEIVGSEGFQQMQQHIYVREFKSDRQNYSYLSVALQKVYQTLSHKNWSDLFVILKITHRPELKFSSNKKVKTGPKFDGICCRHQKLIFKLWDTGHLGPKK